MFRTKQHLMPSLLLIFDFFEEIKKTIKVLLMDFPFLLVDKPITTNKWS